MKSLKNYFKLILVVLLASQTLFAQSKDGLLKNIKSLTYEGYFQFDKSYFIKAIGLCDRIIAVNPDDAEALYYSAYSAYRLVNIGMVKEEHSLIDTYLEKSIDDAKKLFGNEIFSSDAYVVAAASLMMKLAVDISDAPNLSMKIHGYLDNAEKSDQNNPRICLTRGTMFYNTPPQFGGGADKALKQFEMALKLFESNESVNEKVSWGHAEAYAWKGLAHEKLNEIEKSKSAFDTALKIESNFGWVKYQLLPALEKRSDKLSETSAQIKQVKFEKDSQTGNLTVVFRNFDSNLGAVKIALHNSKAGYQESNPFRRGISKIKELKASYVFEDIPFGEYAVKCYHDENMNDELDTNLLGIPSEAYGFSNNARGSFGPPDYNEAKFKFDHNDQEISIKVE